MKVLCICRQGINRSRAMAEFLQKHGYEAVYAGVEPNVLNSVNQEMIDWADTIVTARDVHAQRLREQYDISKKVISLNVENGSYDNPRVQKEVKEQLEKHLPLQ